MKITYEEFLNKLKPEIRKDLEEHPENEYLCKILNAFYKKIDSCLNKKTKNDERLDIWLFHIWDFFHFKECFLKKEYKNAFDYMDTAFGCVSGSYGYAIIKVCEELLYE